MTGLWLGLDLFIDQGMIMVMVMLKEAIDLLSLLWILWTPQHFPLLLRLAVCESAPVSLPLLHRMFFKAGSKQQPVKLSK